jgi:hypothetical protein
LTIERAAHPPPSLIVQRPFRDRFSASAGRNGHMTRVAREHAFAAVRMIEDFRWADLNSG